VTKHRAHVALFPIGALVLAACGASYQSVYEGDVRFEHCYHLDADVAVAPNARLACWTEWTQRYTAGQTRDRVEYALGRQRTLLAGDGRPTGPVILTGAETPTPPPVSSGPAIACPLPSTPYESPPATLAVARPAPVASVALSDVGLPPTQACVKDCGDAFTGCATKCKKTPCVTKCGELAKSCISECL
jgi:hypothetical protein